METASPGRRPILTARSVRHAGWVERKRLGRCPASKAIPISCGLRRGWVSRRAQPTLWAAPIRRGSWRRWWRSERGPLQAKLNSWHHCQGKCDTRSTTRRLRRSKLAYSSTRWSIAPRRGSNRVSLSSKCFRESRFTWNAASSRGKTGEAITA